jgi:ABC-2 type transport system ATP-binding protein
LIIEAHGLKRTYRKGPEALKGVDLVVPEGSRFALLGPNGAGKSTLTRILCTLSRPDAGTVRIDGLALAQGSAEIRSRIGVALQELQLDPLATPHDQLCFQGRLFGLDGRRAKARAEELVLRFGMQEVATRKSKELSGGNQRRLHVALALVHKPRLLFLDEPTVGMDPEIRASFWAELRRLNRDERTTVFFTTQYLDEAEKHADELAVIDAGRVAYRGTVAGFVADQAATAGSLEAGYLRFLEARRLQSDSSTLPPTRGNLTMEAHHE